MDSGVPVYEAYYRNIKALTVHNDIFFASTVQNGILRSKDNGLSWTAANSGIISINVSDQPLFAGDGGIFAGQSDCVYRSIDDGEHWTIAGRIGKNVYITCMTGYENSLFLGTREFNPNIQPQNGIWLSTDNGENWTPVDSGLPDKNVMALVAFDRNIFASTNTGIFRSNDNGTSWNEAKSGFTGAPAPYYSYYPLFKKGACLFTATNSGIFRTTNQDTCWTNINSELSQFGILSFASIGDTLLAGTAYAGIFRSTDNGSRWVPVNSGLRSTKKYTLSVINNTLLALVGEYNIVSTADGGVHWNNITPNFTKQQNGVYSSNYLMKGGTIFTWNYSSDASIRTAFSTDGGFSWTDGIMPISSGGTYAFASIPNRLLIGIDQGVIFSTDGGVSWSGPDSSSEKHPTYTLLWNKGCVIAGTDGGVLLSSDSSKSWKKIPFGLMSMRVEALTICGEALFAGSSYSGVFRSDDNGETWKAVNSGLTNACVYSLISHDNLLFAGTYGSGVFVSRDNGETWKAFNEGIDDKRVSSLVVTGDQLFAGTDGYGVWQRPLSETGVISDRPQLKRAKGQVLFDILVCKNSNSLLTITFSIPYADNVAIRMYSLSGKAVTSIFNRRVEAGEHGIQWNAQSVARGCYIIKMQCGAKNVTRIFHYER
jgi:photosystem II stability/assembly factor-like uncharacterized protein